MVDREEMFSDLNDQQLEAVNCLLGNKLILAGAGSGKTRVLTCRVAKLINTFDVRPSDILALTFTNKASNEMKQRLEKILRISSQGLWFGTFHGICRRLLKIHWKEAGISEYFTILDSQDQLRIIKRVIKSKNLDVKVVNKDIVLFKAIDQEKKYSESAIIDRKSGELIHEITRNIESDNSEKDISFYSCIKKEKKV